MSLVVAPPPKRFGAQEAARLGMTANEKFPAGIPSLFFQLADA